MKRIQAKSTWLQVHSVTSCKLLVCGRKTLIQNAHLKDTTVSNTLPKCAATNSFAAMCGLTARFVQALSNPPILVVLWGMN